MPPCCALWLSLSAPLGSCCIIGYQTQLILSLRVTSATKPVTDLDLPWVPTEDRASLWVATHPLPSMSGPMARAVLKNPLFFVKESP